MIRAVIFDMYETLITHYSSPLYFGAQMAADAGIPPDRFQTLWRLTEHARTIGEMTFEEVIERILKENNRYTEETAGIIIAKRKAAKEECFNHLHEDIIPMLAKLKDNGIKIGLISNCFSEEAVVIRKSILFPYFDAVCLSCELAMQKPDAAIFRRCMEMLSAEAKECLYIGDGKSQELTAASSLGMQAVQAVWYLKEGTAQPVQKMKEFGHLERPLQLFDYNITWFCQDLRRYNE